MKKTIIHMAVFLIALSGYSQKAKVEKADKLYEKYAYIDAIQTYERVAEKGYKSVDVFQKLGNAYYFNGELNKANKWYTELFAMNEPVEAEYYYRYSQTLKSVGDYDKANKMLDQFAQMSGTDLRAKQYSSEKNYLDIIKENSGRYTIDTLSINSDNSDYGSSILGNTLVFASNRKATTGSRKIQKWTNQPFTRLYASTIDSQGNVGAPEEFSSSVDTKFNEATPVFTKDGKTMYFTRNNFNNGKKGKDSDRVTLLKVYKANLKDGKWQEITELPFNSNNYSVAHPALSSDEKTLYFASDMPGTLGQSDLFKADINEDGTFGTPINLGPTINTEGKETFPFVSDKNELYFSSDGHPGLGGLDIFVSKIESTTFSAPVNIGAPVNGTMDDFAFMINTKTLVGFFSSNREGGKGYDDIYKFKEALKCEQLLAGVITDAQTGEILANTKLTLMDESFNVIKEIVSDKDGKYEFADLDCNKKYYIRAEKQEYNTKEVPVFTGKETGKTVLDIELDKTVQPFTVNDDLSKAFKIKLIYFDLDKWNIRPDAALELAKILDVLEQHPTMKIDIRSHTDSRQTHAYNERLSDRRAKSTMAWLVSKGIAKERLTAKGYGENQLINKCSDNVECTEEEHQLNRRSEFIITAL